MPGPTNDTPLPKLETAKKRLNAVIQEIERLLQSDFPYADSRDALELLCHLFQERLALLEKVSPDAPADVVEVACSTSLVSLNIYVPILGFILRSTNIRNAFELYPPLLRLARKVLRDDTKLVVSSEWEYSPYVYLPIKDLPGFVLIGFPAPESANPLVVPLAGHELGHSVWALEDLSRRFQKRIEESVLKELTENRWKEYSKLYQYSKDDVLGGDLLARETWVSAFSWCSLQVEEIFCDCFGLRLFAEAYARAFLYLLGPGSAGKRSLRYPNLRERAKLMVQAASTMQVAVQDNFASEFMHETEPSEPTTRLLISVADTVARSVAPDICALAGEWADKRKVPKRNTDRVDAICHALGRIAPVTTQESTVDLLNAGWQCAIGPELWKDVPQITEAKDKDRILKDLVLKSMEVTEVLLRCGATS